MRSFLDEIRIIVGPAGLITSPDEFAPYATDWRKRYVGKPLAVVRPASTAEAAQVVRACSEARTAIVPQGGNTGLCGGATPDASGSQIVLNLSRMNRLRGIDARNNTMTVEAGCVLATLQKAAEEAGRLFPLSLAAEGSCEIGGNLSTNAGGTAVLRYGNARELVLGLAVVPLEGPEKALALLERTLATCGERITGFELFSDFCLSLVLKHFSDTATPFPRRFPYYVLMELSDTQPGEGPKALVESMLEGALLENHILDAAVAQSETQARAFWKLREFISEAQAHEGQNIKHDVSIPISSIADFISATDQELARAHAGVRMVTFGHVGDGNVHYNVSAPEGVAPDVFVKNTAAINHVVHASVARFGGSISAEHGLGQLKRDEIQRYKSPLELELMRKLKRALDPYGIMNPGKVL